MNVKRLTDSAKLPKKAHTGDLGYDLFSDEEVLILPGQSELIPTGIAVEFPEGYGGIIKDRSSVASKLGLVTAAGVIDNGYVGEIRILLINTSGQMVVLKKGEKIAQLVLVQTVDFDVTEVYYDLESADERGTGGFGSTGTT